MDLELFRKGLDYTNRKKRWVFALGALGFTCYGAYKAYNSSSVTRTRKKMLKLLTALISMAEMMSDSAEAIGTLSKDLKDFIQSENDQIPNSLKQISKITQSDEFSKSLSRITRALTVGILQGYRYESTENASFMNGYSGFSDRVFNKLFSDAGSGFISAIIGSLARNLVMAFYEDIQQDEEHKLNGHPKVDSQSNESVPRWVEVICAEKCRNLIAECVQVFVSTAVSVYLDKTMHINTYYDLFSGLTNPNHESSVRDMLVSVCNGAVETIIRASNQTMTSTISPNSLAQNSAYSKIDFGAGFSRDEKALIGARSRLGRVGSRRLFEGKQESGWVSKMSSTLAVPSNRQFVLDVTGRVTFETVKSFLEVVMEKLSECMKRSVDVMQQEVVDRGFETVRYMSYKTSTVATVCLTLCLHILNGPWILAPS